MLILKRKKIFNTFFKKKKKNSSPRKVARKLCKLHQFDFFFKTDAFCQLTSDMVHRYGSALKQWLQACTLINLHIRLVNRSFKWSDIRNKFRFFSKGLLWFEMILLKWSKSSKLLKLLQHVCCAKESKLSMFKSS